MPKYNVAWSAFGVAEVEADTPEDAIKLVEDGVQDFDYIDWEYNSIDGMETQDPEER